MARTISDLSQSDVEDEVADPTLVEQASQAVQDLQEEYMDIKAICDDMEALIESLTAAAEADDTEIKAGKRNSTSDQAAIDHGYELAEELCSLFEALGADTGEEDAEVAAGDEADDETAEVEGKAIGKREDVNPREGLHKFGDVAYADEKNKKYPIDTEAHIRSAWNYINKADNAAKYSADEVATIKRKIVAAWKQKIDKAGPPSAETKKSLDDADVELLLGGAVKMAADDTIYGPAVWLNGSPDQHDLSRQRDYFTKATDFWLDAWDKRPMLWHHALAESDILDEMRVGGAGDDEIKAMREALDYLRANPVIGSWTKAVADPIAVWLKGQLSKAHRYRSAVKDLIARGLIKISTDSAPHLVVRERQLNGANEVKRWPLITGSLTVSAAEPRLFDVHAIKSLYDTAGIQPPFAFDDNPEADEPNDRERQDAVKAVTDRKRRLALHARLMALQE